MYDDDNEEAEFSELVGATIREIIGGANGSEEILFKTDRGTFRMYHYQNCCESVSVDDIAGDMLDLLGSPVVKAEESSNADERESLDVMTSTWTFYLISTAKGSVTIRWYGTSNGYYSERVSFERVKSDDN